MNKTCAYEVSPLRTARSGFKWPGMSLQLFGGSRALKTLVFYPDRPSGTDLYANCRINKSRRPNLIFSVSWLPLVAFFQFMPTEFAFKVFSLFTNYRNPYYAHPYRKCLYWYNSSRFYSKSYWTNKGFFVLIRYSKTDRKDGHYMINCFIVPLFS